LNYQLSTPQLSTINSQTINHLELPNYPPPAKTGLLLAAGVHRGYSLSMKITLDLPEHAFSSLRQAPDDFAAELRLAACVKWYELGRISQAKAAEISGLSRAAFIDALRAYHVPAVQAAPSDLEPALAL
jgi:predicted HTH domain antitoxin